MLSSRKLLKYLTRCTYMFACNHPESIIKSSVWCESSLLFLFHAFNQAIVVVERYNSNQMKRYCEMFNHNHLISIATSILGTPTTLMLHFSMHIFITRPVVGSGINSLVPDSCGCNFRSATLGGTDILRTCCEIIYSLPQLINVTEPHWKLVNVGSGNGWLPSDIKP